METVLQRLQEVLRHLLPNADGTVALHIGVATQRACAGTGLTNVARQQQGIGHLTNGGDGADMLGSAQSPGDDDRLGVFNAVHQLHDLLARDTAGALQKVIIKA